MKEHIVIPKEKGYKNKCLAQEVGIAIAKTAFEDMLNINYHSFMTDWENPILLNFAGKSLSIYYQKMPKNIEELKKISIEASQIEFDNLKESYDGELPVRIFTDDEVISTVVSVCTKGFFMIKQTHFYAENKKVENIDEMWKSMFATFYSTKTLLSLSEEKAQEIFNKKSVKNEIRPIIIEQIKAYWDKIVLPDDLYSAR